MTDHPPYPIPEYEEPGWTTVDVSHLQNEDDDPPIDPYLRLLQELLAAHVIYGDDDGHVCVGMIGDEPFEDDLTPEARETLYRLLREHDDR